MVSQMLLWGECYENVYTQRRASCPQSNLNDGQFVQHSPKSNIWNAITKLFFLNTLYTIQCYICPQHISC
jgi:hypothetical protein